MPINTDMQDHFLAALVEHVQAAVKEQIEREYEATKAEMLARLEQKKNETIAAVLLSVMKTVDMQHLQDRVVFTIHQKPSQA